MTRYQQQQERAGGRFGRPLAPRRTDAMDDVSTPTDMEREAGRFASATYRVDPDAVASAIVARLLAGGTLRAARADD
jgi:hypothetical protein